MYRVNANNVHDWAARVMGAKITLAEGVHYAIVRKKADADFIRQVNDRAAECVTVKQIFGA